MYSVRLDYFLYIRDMRFFPHTDLVLDGMWGPSAVTF